ncbi:MAG: tellurite resistance/C4-dicarboxylate transporter family protein [Proteobacteria bacterium]|nr:tellurite resistance/C4-dicarboxylate transporter family protein [Pseudomonadota bacterium]
MDSNTAKLTWLKNLYPGYFTLTMATGIIAIALDMLEMPMLSDVLYIITLFTWFTLFTLYTWRLIRFPKIVWADLMNPRTTFTFFSFVAATDISGILFHLHGLYFMALLCWIWAFLAWSALLHCSFSVLTLRHVERTVNVVHGGWLICIVGTQSLVLLGVKIVPQLGEYAAWMMVGIYMLWGVGLILYGIFVTLFCYRIFFLDMNYDDYTPLMWVIMGAAAISANAGSALALSDPIMPVLVALHPLVSGVALLTWAWATWWIPLLVVIGYWKHFVHHIPLRYEPTQWSMVFPLGMYAVTSFRLALAAEFEPLNWISHIMVWVALTVWCLVMMGLFHRLLERHEAKETP